MKQVFLINGDKIYMLPVNSGTDISKNQEIKIDNSNVDPITRLILRRGGILNLTHRITADPIGVYTTLKERRVSSGPNFSFPEAAESIGFLAKQLNSSPPSENAIDIWNGMKTSFFKELRNVIKSDFAYLYTLNFIHKHLESLHYYYLKAGFYENRYSADTYYPPDTMKEYAVFFGRLIDDPGIIAFPTVENLSPGYFAKIQSVRAYPLAVSIAPETSADGRMKSPTHMFVHDMQHVEDGETAFRKTEGSNELEKMERCQNNYLQIKSAFADLKIKQVWRVCKLILFQTAHELAAVKFVPIDLKNRILEKDFIPSIIYGIENNHFEKIDSTMIEFLEPAKAHLLKIIDSNVLL